MVAPAAGGQWCRGKVKAVPSGDSLVVTALSALKAGPPRDKTLILSYIIAPRLAHRGGIDEPFAWGSREFLRKLCIGKEVTFRVDYTVASIGREFGTVMLDGKNVAMLVVVEGWAKVKKQGSQKGEASPFLTELLHLEEQAKQHGVGCWTKVPGAAEAAIRKLPPSAIGDSGNFDAVGLLAANKGRPVECMVEQVQDGSTLQVNLLPEFQYVRVIVAGIQAPAVRWKPAAASEVDTTSDEINGDISSGSQGPLYSAQRLAASTVATTDDPYMVEAKHFTELRVLNREGCIVLEGVDKCNNLIGSVYYPDGETAKDLALELVENGLAKYVEWSANLMEEDAKRRLKNAELQAKKSRLKIWTNYVPPARNSKAIHDQNFTGKVLSGDCIIVADDSVPYGSPFAKRLVNHSSIRCPKIGNPCKDEKPAPAAVGQWYRGQVKAVPSGDSLVVTALSALKAGPPRDKTLILSSVIAPRLARRGGTDEPFAWDSREFLRKLCIGKEATFRVDYTVASIGREFGTVILDDKNVAMLVVAEGWAKVKEQGSQKGEASPFLAELLCLEEQAKQQGLGRWSKVPGAAEASIRKLPPSAIGDSGNFDAMGLLNANKGTPMECMVEHVLDGSTLRVYLLPEFQYVQVLVAGIQAPAVGQKPAAASEVDTTTDEINGDISSVSQGPLNSAQGLALAASAVATTDDPYMVDAKHFTELCVLNREVRIVLEGVDKFNNLIGSVYYSDGESAKDLALELVENGLAKYVEWSANLMEEDAKRRLKNAELQAKKSRLRIWTNYVPPATNSKAIHDQNFTGKVVEVVSGDCIIVADDSVSYGSPLAERQVNLSSIRCPKIGNPRKDEKPAPYAKEAREFLRTRLIGKQVNVQMEYSRKVPLSDVTTTSDSRIMDFGSVFLQSSVKGEGDDTSSVVPSYSAYQPTGINVAELVVSCGFGIVVEHQDFEEGSIYYDDLLAAESHASAGKKGVHSSKDPSVMDITDLTMASVKKARDFLLFLQRSWRIPAIVEYVVSGHRFKLLIPNETCSIAFSFSGVRCPSRGEPYSEEAIALLRRKILHRDVEIEVETVDRTGTFLGSLWESRTNVAVTLLEAGLAKLQTSFGSDRLPEAHLLEQAELSAKSQKLKIWENYVEEEEVASTNGSALESKQKLLKVVVTEVLGGGKFYVQEVGDLKVASVQQQLASLHTYKKKKEKKKRKKKKKPSLYAFNPKKGDIVLAQFSADNSWNRAMIVNAPQGNVESLNDKFEVFYIDYGNQEVVPYSSLGRIDPSLSVAPGLAQLCSLAYIKVPGLEDEYGPEAAEFLSQQTLSSSKEFRAKVEKKDTSGGKVKGQGSGMTLVVTLVAVDAEISINALMLQEGLARVERRKKWEAKDRQAALENLEKFQEEARTGRLGVWEYGDVQSDDEDSAPPAGKAGGRR